MHDRPPRREGVDGVLTVVLPGAQDVPRAEHLGRSAVLELDRADHVALGDQQPDAALDTVFVRLRAPGACAHALDAHGQLPRRQCTALVGEALDQVRVDVSQRSPVRHPRHPIRDRASGTAGSAWEMAASPRTAGLERAGAAAWRLLGLGLLVVAAWWLTRKLMPVLLPLVVALLLATLLRPLAAALERRRPAAPQRRRSLR